MGVFYNERGKQCLCDSTGIKNSGNILQSIWATVEKIYKDFYFGV